ncbi:hypothetical protein A2291_05505 [candidate division WOR-1 bacterium RIFOXYB2_FULL_42_35]|uniref:Metallo-beta-lactamase domain-containing protein n=1 Tax=candidate division WOR-1 bacterium RIFOXYC2_FULL_41_25 TaxID=1802586 RepID=A0A1F4TNR9_UNCSA|nr:MAG: hypothetical protein A2247_00275 [candidate division WOR-1 bacterium RIFOXYA2_FULL_41_14]OGC24795.1 MAG: hypothetical protein A2291_05505 [candidate division WOR-1 bacterium RIFOXYB2_FULL_42_35]OGC34354.1 MAG: hypothetical protein A2462_07835 [candidate division WOR-1 bacterium RIFOXYC2_FULL_41_25]OGC43034.1 MAG: hypothetical protein A2548_07375 [candidate division WOR-1 bacterium RIFOXYD2_FULL_41_8]
MQIKTIKVGYLRTNCYILSDEQTHDAVVIDPGDEADLILPELAGLKVHYIIITHGHYDHVGAIADVKRLTKAKTVWHEDNFLGQADWVLHDGDEIKFGRVTLKVLHTPGHSPGGICLYTKGHLFSGDTLFYTTYGRVDLQGSSPRQMSESLQRLAALPDETIVYPGHEEFTSIGQEKEFGTIG